MRASIRPGAEYTLPEAARQLTIAGVFLASGEYKVRFTKQTWPGETLSTKIVVTGKQQTEAGKRVLADVSLVNQDGEIKLQGAAVVIAG